MTSRVLHLSVRTPAGLLVGRSVRSIRAEDRDGWFGVLRGRRDLVAVLDVGLVIFEDDEGDAFVAHSGGVLELRDGDCRLMTLDATLAREVEDAAADLGRLLAARAERSERRRGVLEELEREALRRLSTVASEVE